MQIISSTETKKEQTKQEKSSAKREALRTKILGYADLPDDFDGYDGHAPTQKDIENALSFIPYIPNAGLAAIRAMVDGGGDVGFEWGRDIELEIGFTDGKISFYGDTPDGEDISDTQIYDGTVPAKLKRLLAAVFSD